LNNNKCFRENFKFIEKKTLHTNGGGYRRLTKRRSGRYFLGGNFVSESNNSYNKKKGGKSEKLAVEK